MSFYKLGIKSDLVYALDLEGVDQPTPIQKLAIPHALKGRDLLAEAQTGTGKTYAFLLPTIQMIDPEKSAVQGLVLAPTRELAIQITQVAKSLCEIRSLGVVAVYGGQDVQAQLSKLKGQTHIVIATPGRLLDHLRRGTLDLSSVNHLIIDEADQMLHIGFKVEVDAIIKMLPKWRHTMCFTATMSQKVLQFSKKHLNMPISVEAPKEQITLDEIEQYVLMTSGRKKYVDFESCLKLESPSQALIFCRSRRGTQSLYESMAESGYNVESLHGDLTQAKRENVMKRFKEGKIQYLVATDVASRGIDVSGLSHVFNYNLPDDPENYVHRIGRTGRAGETGRAITFLTEKDSKRFEAIEAFIQQKIAKYHIGQNSAQNDRKSK